MRIIPPPARASATAHESPSRERTSEQFMLLGNSAPLLYRHITGFTPRLASEGRTAGRAVDLRGCGEQWFA